MNQSKESNQGIESKNRIKESNQRIESKNRIKESNQGIESMNQISEVPNPSLLGSFTGIISKVRFSNKNLVWAQFWRPGT